MVTASQIPLTFRKDHQVQTLPGKGAAWVKAVTTSLLQRAAAFPSVVCPESNKWVQAPVESSTRYQDNDFNTLLDSG